MACSSLKLGAALGRAQHLEIETLDDGFALSAAGRPDWDALAAAFVAERCAGAEREFEFSAVRQDGQFRHKRAIADAEGRLRFSNESKGSARDLRTWTNVELQTNKPALYCVVDVKARELVLPS